MATQRDNFKDLTKNITIDAENRITQVKDALNVTVGTYWYDEGGFQVRRTALTPQGAGFVNTEILYPNKFYGLEYVETEAVLRSINNIYLNGVRIAALNEEGTAAYFLTDQVDSVAHILDDNAHTLSRMQYEPYGETLVQRGNQNFAPKFNSQELDRETNFYFYNARYYDPQIARFTSADTVIDGNLDTQGWNRFAYVRGNPIRHKDPTGHERTGPVPDSETCANLGFSSGVVRSVARTLDGFGHAIEVLKRTSPNATMHDEKGFVSSDSLSEPYEKGSFLRAFDEQDSIPNGCDELSYRGNQNLGDFVGSGIQVARSLGRPAKSPQASTIYDIRTKGYRSINTGQFVKPNWPQNNGFNHSPINITLKPGTVIDRFGSLKGKYAGKPGTSISKRGMAPGSEKMKYTKLRVNEQMKVPGGLSAPVREFAAEGKGMQYYFEKGIQHHIDNGQLSIIK